MNAPAPRRRSRALGCVQWFVVILFLLPAALGIPGVLAYNWVDHQLHTPANPGNAKVRFVVPPGASFHEVADTLHRAGLIDSVTVFDLYARYKHLDRNVQAGAYEISRNLDMIQILQALQTAVPEEIFVTVPEGYTIKKTAALLDQGGVIKGSDYIAQAVVGQFNQDFLKDLPPGASLEGFLFPDTYLIPRNGTAKQLITLQLDQFGRQRVPPDIGEGTPANGDEVEEGEHGSDADSPWGVVGEDPHEGDDRKAQPEAQGRPLEPANAAVPGEQDRD